VKFEMLHILAAIGQVDNRKGWFAHSLVQVVQFAELEIARTHWLAVGIHCPERIQSIEGLASQLSRVGRRHCEGE
jgi:hypothetical protein